MYDRTKALKIAETMLCPDSYEYMDFHAEWVPVVHQAMDDLSRLAREDGCVAAAWAMIMIETTAGIPA